MSNAPGSTKLAVVATNSPNRRRWLATSLFALAPIYSADDGWVSSSPIFLIIFGLWASTTEIALSLTHIGRIIADVTIHSVTLRPLAGAYELVFALQINIAQDDEAIYWATISGARVTFLTSGGSLQDLGIARPSRPLRLRTNPFAGRTTSILMCTVQPNQIEAIENARDGGKITFELTGYADAGDASSNYPIDETWRIEVASSEWIGQLNQSDAANILLIEVPMPVGNIPNHLKQMTDRLREAQRQFLHGEYQSCISICRLVLDEWGQTRFGKSDWAGQALSRFADARKEMSKDDRHVGILAATRHYAHQAHHSVGDGGVTEVVPGNRTGG